MAAQLLLNHRADANPSENDGQIAARCIVANLGAASGPDKKRGREENRRGKEGQAERSKKRKRSAETAWTAVPPRRSPREERKHTGE
jgi:hypothetical protein